VEEATSDYDKASSVVQTRQLHTKALHLPIHGKPKLSGFQLAEP
jgi:hypothetical protein